MRLGQYAHVRECAERVDQHELHASNILLYKYVIASDHGHWYGVTFKRRKKFQSMAMRQTGKAGEGRGIGVSLPVGHSNYMN